MGVIENSLECQRNAEVFVTPAKATEGSAEPGVQLVEFPGAAFPSVRFRRSPE
jgi:hypothetical protein